MIPDRDTDISKETQAMINWGVKSKNLGKSFMEEMAFNVYHEEGNYLEGMRVVWER